eukprot:TRINITY_DN9636_c0_g1_i9.p3 TRINITY_DN9636_c0_g1~~TRINITY_DN9636_c0_g1_i9.p3  ORF type:complete len:128 (+),score=4.33 TRINITY_DN9636_c0_g1_i9:780-1163(+)
MAIRCHLQSPRGWPHDATFPSTWQPDAAPYFLHVATPDPATLFPPRGWSFDGYIKRPMRQMHLLHTSIDSFRGVCHRPLETHAQSDGSQSDGFFSIYSFENFSFRPKIALAQNISTTLCLLVTWSGQ